MDALIGIGGEGTVYEVTLQPDGRRFALKWYHPEWCTRARWDSIEKLVEIGAPDQRFIWPMDLALDDNDRFGYLMRLLDKDRFAEMSDHMSRRIDPRLRELATAGMELADSFLQLHAKGLCYRDISFGNVFLDPTTGAVLICDVDNVGVDGTPSGVLGTHYFMAPEILRREAAPSIRTDRFSLAVLLFYMLMLNHPLLGKRETEAECLGTTELARLCGEDPVFIFAPDDESNRPVPGQHDNALTFWPVYPQYIRKLFTRAFTTGLVDPTHGRVSEGEWRRALARLRDSVTVCGLCRQQNFRDAAATQPQLCCNPRCGLPLAPAPRLVLEGGEVVLSDGAALYPHHIGNRLFDYSVPRATVSQHPTYDLAGLRNASEQTWVATGPDGTVYEVTPGKAVGIVPGTRLAFGPVEGTIEA